MSGTTIDDVVKRLSTPEIGEKPPNLPSPPPPWSSILNYPDTIAFFLDVKLKVEAATTLRDSLDHYTSGQIYTPFLKKLMPIFINILRGPCVFQSNSLEQVRRYVMHP